MTTLHDLRVDLFPAARPIGQLVPAGRPVAWVRVMRPRVPAFDALEPGDIAIVPGSALAVVAPTDTELQPLVAAFAAAPVSGVLLLDGESLTGSGPARLDGLAAALAAARIAGLRLPAADPAAVERSVIGAILGRASELERQAGLLEAELERRALAGEGSAGLMAAAASFLARPLALESPRGDPLAVHAPREAPDAGPAVAAYAAGRRDAVSLRVPLPSGGAVAILGAGEASDRDRTALARVAGLLALELARDEAVRRAADRGGRTESLPSGGPPWVVVVARQRDPGDDPEDAADRERREQLRREIRLLAPARQLALRGDADSLEVRAVCAAGGDGGETATLALAGRLASLLGRTVAVSRSFDGPADRPAAEAEARATLEAAVALPDPPAVARAERLPAYRLMGALHNLPDGTRLARALLEPILVGRADVRREHLATLAAVLDRGGVSEAAAALGVHRNTIAYRLRRIEALTGWRLDDPELRVPLAIALRLVHEDQL